MKSSVLLGLLCAAGALASPLDKRVYVTDVVVVTVTTTVTDEPTAAPTSTAVTSAVVTSEPVQKIPAPAPTSSQAPTPAPAPLVAYEKPAPEQPAPVAVSSSSTSTSFSSETTQSSTALAYSSAWTFSSAATFSQTLAPVPAPATTLSTTTAAPAPTAPLASGYQSLILYNHNIHRSNHSVDSLTWSADLEASAQALAQKCVYQHDTSINGGGYGQNIGYGISADNIGEMITNLMYNNEEGYFSPYYGQSQPSMADFDKWGHFTQIVWKGTTQVGCATVTCNGLGNVDSSSPLPFTVCNYSPPGNYDGEYADNVLKPLGQPFYAVSS